MILKVRARTLLLISVFACDSGGSGATLITAFHHALVALARWSWFAAPQRVNSLVIDTTTARQPCHFHYR